MSSQTVPAPAISTEHYGITTGLAFNDIIGIGKFPLEAKIAKIVKIFVSHTEIFDGFQVTYKLVDGTEVVSPAHGNLRAEYNETIVIGNDEELVGAVGKSGAVNNNSYGPSSICAFSFSVYNSTTGKLKTYGPYGRLTPQSPKTFRIGGSIVAFGGSAFVKEQGSAFLQSISFFRKTLDALIIPAGIYRLENYGNEDLQITLPSADNGQLMDLDFWNENQNQLWEFIPKLDGTYFIKNVKFGKWLATKLEGDNLVIVGNDQPVEWMVTIAARDVGETEQVTTYHICAPGTGKEILYRPKPKPGQWGVSLVPFKTNNNTDQLWVFAKGDSVKPATRAA